MACGSFSGFALTRQEADERAALDAAQKLKAMLETECDVVPCPKCGAFTREMERAKVDFLPPCLGAIGLGALIAGGVYYVGTSTGKWYYVMGLLGVGLFTLGAFVLIIGTAGLFHSKSLYGGPRKDLPVVHNENSAKAEELPDSSLATQAVALDPWICPRCAEPLEGQFTSCWKCGASREGRRTVESLCALPPEDPRKEFVELVDTLEGFARDLIKGFGSPLVEGETPAREVLYAFALGGLTALGVQLHPDIQPLLGRQFPLSPQRC